MTTYQQARQELISALAQDTNNLDSLQKIYKLPNSYAFLGPPATVHALEMLNVFSPEDPLGIIEIPSLLGMKETSKKMKKILRCKKTDGFKFRGVNELHSDVDFHRLMEKVQFSSHFFQAELELLQDVLQSKSNTITSIADTLVTFNEVIEKTREVIAGLTQVMMELHLEPKSRVAKDAFSKSFQMPHERQTSAEHPIRFVHPPVKNTGSDPLNRKHYFADEVHNSPMSCRRPLPPPPKANSPAYRKCWSPILPPTRVIEKEAEKQKSRKLQSEESAGSQQTHINNPNLQELIAKQAAKFRVDSAKLQHRYPVGSYEAINSFNPQTISGYDDVIMNHTTSPYITKPFAHDDSVLNQQTDSGPHKVTQLKTGPPVSPKPTKGRRPKVPLLPPHLKDHEYFKLRDSLLNRPDSYVDMNTSKQSTGIADNNISPNVKKHEYQNVQQKERPPSYVTMKRPLISPTEHNPFQNMSTSSLSLPTVEYDNVGPGLHMALDNDLLSSDSDEELEENEVSNFSWDGHQIKEEYDTFTSSASYNPFANY